MQEANITLMGVCERCGKNLKPAIKVLGRSLLEGIHHQLHRDEDVRILEEVAYELAQDLAGEGYDTEAMDRLKKLDPELYNEKVTG